MPTPCVLKPTPLDPSCEFTGTPGAVTLTVEDVIGAVVFTSAAYDGVEILPMPSRTITLTLVAGRKSLDVVYAFSDTVNGEGVLKEVCERGQELIRVHARVPAQRYHICA